MSVNQVEKARSLECFLAMHRARFSGVPQAVIRAKDWVEWQREGFRKESPLIGFDADEWRNNRTWKEVRDIRRQTEAYRTMLAGSEGDEARTKAIKSLKAGFAVAVTWSWSAGVVAVDGQDGVDGGVGYAFDGLDTWPQRKAQSATTLNPLVCYDLDDIPSGEVEAARDAVVEAPGVLASGISLSNRGVWCVLLVDRVPDDGRDDFQRIWWTGAAHLHSHGFKVEHDDSGGVDRAPSSPVSLRFASHDAGLKINRDATPFPIPQPAEMRSHLELMRECGFAVKNAGRAASKKTTASRSTEAERGDITEGASAGAEIDADPGITRRTGKKVEGEPVKAPHPRVGKVKFFRRAARIPLADQDDALTPFEFARMLSTGCFTSTGEFLDRSDFTAWLKAGFLCRLAVIEGVLPDEAAAKEAWRIFSEGASNFSDDDWPDAAWDARIAPYEPTVTMGSLVELYSTSLAGRRRERSAEEVMANGSVGHGAARMPPEAGAPDHDGVYAPDDEGDDPGCKEWGGSEGDGYILSEVDLAGYMRACRWGSEARLIEERGEWAEWVGDRWLLGTDRMIPQISLIGRDYFNRQSKDGVRYRDPTTGGRASTAKGALSELAGMEGMKRPLAQWDEHRCVLALPDGLMTQITPEGAVTRNQRRDDYLLRPLPVAPAPQWEDSLFGRFLREVVPGEGEREFLQAVFGYGLICDGSEDVLLANWPAERSGKSTLMAAIEAAVGRELMTSVPEGALSVNRGAQRHLAELAKLAGKRILRWDETTSGSKLNTDRVKMLSGGDTMSANFMRQNHFEFDARSLLIVSTNSPLELTKPDKALVERMRIIDTWKPIPADRRDTSIRRRLRDDRAEAAFVLRWMIDGAVDYLRRRAETNGRSGLPKETGTMLQAKHEWRENADPVSEFLTRWEAGTEHIRKGEVFNDYRKWHVVSGNQYQCGQKEFYRRVREKFGEGVEKRTAVGRFFMLQQVPGVDALPEPFFGRGRE